MSLELSLAVKEQIFFRAGEYRQTFLWNARPSLISEKACLLLISWDVDNYGWLKVALKSNPNPEIRAKLTPLDLNASSQNEDLQILVERHRNGQGFGNHFQNRNYLALQWYPGLPLQLDILVDSNHSEFKKIADTRIDPTKPLNIKLDVKAFSSSVHAGEQGSISLSLSPCVSLPAFQGGVALDLGNSSSSLVACRFNTIRMADILELGNEEPDRAKRLAEQSTPVESVIRIDQVVTPKLQEAKQNLNNHGEMNRCFGKQPFKTYDEVEQSACSYVVGRTARHGVASDCGRLIFGAKRLLQKEKSESLSYKVQNKDWILNRIHETPVQFENHHPAEFLVSRLFRNFASSILSGGNVAGFPQALAITYPTTYDRHEIEKLRATVTKAWLRFMGFPQQNLPDFPKPSQLTSPKLGDIYKYLDRKNTYSDQEENPHPLVPLMIDEATAAAFYFLYKHVFEFPGGLASFGYLYPKGLTLLLYDCGGGTTDIALVQAKLDAQRTDRLLLNVLGRTGDGNFGGDNITVAICKLIKAKITEAILKSNQDTRIPSMGITTNFTAEALQPVVTKYIADMETRNGNSEDYVPTKFDPSANIFDAEAKSRLIELWTWAEKIKIALSGPKLAEGESQPATSRIQYDPVSKSVSGVQIGLATDFNPETSPLAKMIISKFDETDLAEVLKKIQKIEIRRTEVDALILSQLTGTVRRANKLIRTKLEKINQENDVPNLDFVVISGNGGRYPFVDELLTKELYGVGIEDKKALLPVEDLKDAVAKGAVLFLNCMKVQGRARVDFDTKLSDRLPFDIGWYDNKTQKITMLYEEGRKYSDLTEIEIPVFNAKDPHAATQKVTILRRYPGEEDGDSSRPGSYLGFNSYITFDFREPIQGNIFLSFNQETNEFSARDGGNNEAIKPYQRHIEEEKTVSPIESGKI